MVGGRGRKRRWMGGLVGGEKRGWDFVHVHIIRYGFPPILTFWEVEGLLRRAKKEKREAFKEGELCISILYRLVWNRNLQTYPPIHPHGRIDEWAVLFKG